MATPTTIDVTGLPEPVIADLRRLVETLRGRPARPPEPTLPPPTRRPLIGCLEGQGLRIPTLEEIAEVRREMWANFPREFPNPGTE